MKEIKVRAWDTVTKKYISSSMKLICESELVARIYGVYRHPIVIEQYINKEDKNGKEIYEGDILEDYNGIRATVEWGETEIVLHGHGEVNKEQAIGYYFPGHFDINGAAIIGNTHENKELL